MIVMYRNMIEGLKELNNKDHRKPLVQAGAVRFEDLSF